MIANLSFMQVLTLTVLTGCAWSFGESPALLAQGAGVSVHDVWIRQPAGARKEAAAFAVVENGSAAPRAIIGAKAALADKAELHEMKMNGAMMQMSPVKQIEVPAHGKVELKPGGLHVMLFGLQKALMPGDTVVITFTFDDGTTTTAAASVRQDDGMKMNESSMPRK